MENVKIKRILNELGRITGLEIEGVLVLENSQQLKKEFVDVIDFLSDQVKITITYLDEMDLSCIQLILAFIKRMDEMNITYQLDWNLDENQKSFLVNVGLKNELLMNH